MSGLDQAFTQHHRRLWGVCYRLLGTGVDADEVVQETFVRALEHRPDPEPSLWPWLLTVATNLSRDRLRRRRRRPYDGSWLPSVVATDGLPGWVRGAPAGEGPEAVVARRSEVDYAWLIALEALTPKQRAVVVLREALDLTSAEVATVLGTTEGSVRVTLHRARRALAGASAVPAAADPGLLMRFAAALQAADVAELAKLLAPDAVATSDGGGEFHAALRPIVGADAVARMYVGLLRKSLKWGLTPSLRELNCRPAVVIETAQAPPGFASRSVTLFDVRDGRVRGLWSVLATDKLR